jgi:CTP-dependent riboflavin kinase
VIWLGVVTDGLGECSQDCDWPADWCPGSLNLAPVDEPLLGRVRHMPPDGWDRQDYQGVPTICEATVRGIAVVVFVEYPNVVELVARQNLRRELGLVNGDELAVDIDDWACVL